MECNDGDPQYPELKLVKTKRFASWLFDTSYHPDRYKGLVDYFNFDHNFLANPLTIQEYKAWGYDNVAHMPYACDPYLHWRPLGCNRERDAVLVGSIRDDRQALADNLQANGVSLELIGGVFREEYIDTLESANIVVNQNPEQGRGLLNMRAFEAPAAGCLLLTENQDLLANDLDIFYCYGYNNIQDIVDVCSLDKYAIQSERKRCQEAVMREHTYGHRCRSILETVFPNAND
jgi:hypothetical protein